MACVRAGLGCAQRGGARDAGSGARGQRGQGDAARLDAAEKRAVLSKSSAPARARGKAVARGRRQREEACAQQDLVVA